MADQGRNSDLSDLKIAFQVISHDGMRIIVPALATLIGVVTCSGLFVWSFLELQKFSPQSIAITRIEAAPSTVAVVESRPVELVDSTPSRPVKKIQKRVAKKPAARAPRRVQYRQDDLFFAPDNPTGGRVVRATESVTEYSWD